MKRTVMFVVMYQRYWCLWQWWIIWNKSTSVLLVTQTKYEKVLIVTSIRIQMLACVWNLLVFFNTFWYIIQLSIRGIGKLLKLILSRHA